MKILIVEDQRRLGQFLKRSLSEHAYTATWVQTCREARDAPALEAYRNSPLDTAPEDLLTEIRLPLV